MYDSATDVWSVCNVFRFHYYVLQNGTIEKRQKAQVVSGCGPIRKDGPRLGVTVNYI